MRQNRLFEDVIVIGGELHRQLHTDVRITVICHDTRLSGFDLEDRMSDQKSKQELKIRYRSRPAHS